MSNIHDFPLIWRWTSPSHALFSTAQLALLVPCFEDDAQRLHDNSLRYFSGRALELDKNTFQVVHSHPADVSTDEGCRWLRDQFGELSARISISWDPQTALETRWDLFTSHWNDFCYPSSDDVFISPIDNSWLL